MEDVVCRALPEYPFDPAGASHLHSRGLADCGAGGLRRQTGGCSPAVPRVPPSLLPPRHPLLLALLWFTGSERLPGCISSLEAPRGWAAVCGPAW